MTVSPAGEVNRAVSEETEPLAAPAGPIRPARATTEIHRHFRRGHEQPRGVVWFGVRSFWGHLRHFIASAIATEDIDSRDWMTPDAPEDLAERVAAVLGGTRGTGNVVDSIGRDLWIVFRSVVHTS